MDPQSQQASDRRHKPEVTSTERISVYRMLYKFKQDGQCAHAVERGAFAFPHSQWKRNSVSVYSAWLHVTDKNMKILCVIQERFMANLCRRQQ